MDIYYCPWH